MCSVGSVTRNEHWLNPLLELTHINVSSRPITESLITKKTHDLDSKYRYVHEMVMLYVHLPTAIVLSWSAGGALQQDDGNTQVTRKSPF